MLRRILAIVLCASLSGCGEPWEQPTNTVNLNSSASYMAERRVMPARIDQQAGDAIRWNQERCTTPLALEQGLDIELRLPGEDAMPLSPGDLVRLTLPGNEAPTGLFKVDTGFVLSFDQLGDLNVRGMTVQQAEAELSRRLVENRYFRAGHAHIALKLLDRGPIRVRVAGAVFLPGQVVINNKNAQDRDVTHDTAAGDHALGRAVSNALASAGGVRPDAEITRITLTRRGQRHWVNLGGLLTGDDANDVLLADGDQVEVSSRGCFQLALARPSSITPPGVRTFISNLTTPASSNAQSAVNHEATNFPYGTNFLQALVSGNCVGGIQSTNADRYGVLISINPVTGKSEVIERRIEDLVRRSDRDGYNPIILPNDAIACYDSRVTNLRDVAKTALDILLGGIVKP